MIASISRCACSSLAVRAAQLGAPWLLSFSGMAEVLGWPPRAPLVAECDRARVLRSWAGECGGREPRLRTVPFAAVRSLQPADFVRVLAEDLQVLYVLGHHACCLRCQYVIDSPSIFPVRGGAGLCRL